MKQALRIVLAYRLYLFRKSVEVAAFLQERMVLVLLLWLLFAVPCALLRLWTTPSPIHNVRDAAPILLAYAAILLAPPLGYLVGKHAFLSPESRRQPSFRWAVYGKWRSVDEGEARAHPDYGPLGFLISLVIGILLNVVVRTGEYFVAVPAIGMHAPGWALALFALMSLDVAVAGFFYMATFAMAMAKVPLFPRMLLYTWMMDVMMQLVIASELSRVGGVPPQVAAPLVDLLQGNIVKVAISVVVWLPYLLLSRRVNVTYRHRLAAERDEGPGGPG